MPSTNFLFSGLSSCAEYQHVEMMPMASSPICCSNASSIAVMPPRIGVLPPYSLYCLKNLNPLEPAKPMKKEVDVLLELRDIGAVVGRDQRRPELLHHLAAGVLE